MNTAILNTIMLAAGFLTLFVSAEILHHFLKVKAEITRKYVHIMTGVITLLFPVLLGSHWLVLLLCGSFAVILYYSRVYNFLLSINGIHRESHGSLMYPLVVYINYLVYDYYDNYLFFYLPILILAISDPMAALVGKRWKIFCYKLGKDLKTGVGSCAFCISAMIISVILLFTMTQLTVGPVILLSLVIAIATTFLEGASQKGMDNLTIPIGATVILVIANQLLIF